MGSCDPQIAGVEVIVMAKGYIYTLFVVVLVLSIITLVELRAGYQNNLETSSKVRGDLMLSVINDVYEDLSRSSYIATKRAMFGLINLEVTNGTFINSTDSAIMNVSIDGIYDGSFLELMENTTINDWLVSVQYIMGQMGVNSSVSLENYTLVQVDPYKFELTTVYEVDVFDPISKIRVKKNDTQRMLIDYQYFEDPLNTVKSNLLFSTAVIPCNLTSAYGKALIGNTSALNWTAGKVFKSLDSAGIAGLSASQRAEKILVSVNISKFSLSDVNGFKGVISETDDDMGGVTVPKIIDATDAYSYTDNSYIAAMSDEIDKWINNIRTPQGTTCFIEHDLGPTYFDRMEGRTAYGKYPGPGIATFIDPTILPKKAQKELDFVYWSS